MNNDNFLIEESDLAQARDICRHITDTAIRNRAIANAFAGNIAKKYFLEADADTESGLHNIAAVLKDIEISDIYINSCYIDVRLYFNDNELFVPKELFDRELLPVAFMFIKVSPDLSGGTVTGFIQPAEINTENLSDNYYRVDETKLLSFYDIEPLLMNKQYADLIDNIDVKIFAYLDGSLEDVNNFYKALLSSRDARTKLAIAAKAQDTFSAIKITAAKQENIEAGTSDNAEIDIELTAEEKSPQTLDFGLEQEIIPLEEEENGLSLDGIGSDELEGPVFSLEDSDDFQIEELEPVETELETFGDTEELQLQEKPVNIQEESTEIEDTPVGEITIGLSNFTDEAGETVEIEENNDDIDFNEIVSSPQEEELEGAVDDFSITEDLPHEVIVVPEQDNSNIIQESSPDVDTDFSYSTEVTPSIGSLEEEDEGLSETSLNIEEDSEGLIEEKEKEDAHNAEQEPQIDALFNNTGEEEDNSSESEDYPGKSLISKKKPISKVIPIVGILAIAGGLSYFGYTKFFATSPAGLPPAPDVKQTKVQKTPVNTAKEPEQQEAMPVETVENVEMPKPTDEGTAVSIPAIEQNLDASILVSNLSVNWEVPSGYVSNTTAKRYFLKLGKIIQLNLKTELLLLNKPPITNKIAVELEFDKAAKKFNVKGITASSGEKTIDEVIIKTVENALDIKLRMNTNSFSNITGNPVLVIHL